jgi:hypothetical protein
VSPHEELLRRFGIAKCDTSVSRVSSKRLGSFSAAVLDCSVAAGAVLATIPLEKEGLSVRMSPTDRAVVFVGGHGGLLMCNTATGARTQLHGHEGSAYGLCVSEDGKLLASGSNDLTMKLWETATGRCLWTSSPQAGSVCSVVMHGDMVFCGVSKSNAVGLRMSDGTPGMFFAAKAWGEVFGLAVTRGEARVRVFASSEGNAWNADIVLRLSLVVGL